MPQARAGAGDTVGWMVTLDASTWCVECAADEAAVARAWGDGEGPDLLVGALNRALARELGLRCARCGRALAEVTTVEG